MHIGAQPVPPSLIREWKKVFPQHEYDTNYGLTESTGPGCVHLGVDNMHKVGAIGRPGFDWEFQIVDDNSDPVENGNPGELMIKGPGVMKAYYRNPEATRSVLMDGWLKTGDIAREDAEGFIWLVEGRTFIRSKSKTGFSLIPKFRTLQPSVFPVSVWERLQPQLFR